MIFNSVHIYSITMAYEEYDYFREILGNDLPVLTEIEQEIPASIENEPALVSTNENEVPASIEKTLNVNCATPKKKKNMKQKKSVLQKKGSKLKLKIKSALSKVKKTVNNVKKIKKYQVKKSAARMTASPRPALVLQNIHFLNECGTKHVSIGYDAGNNFRLSIILATNQSYVHFSVSDWLAFMLNFIELTNYLKQTVGVDEQIKFHTSNNIKISKENINKRNFIYIENLPRTRLNNGILLDYKEFERCLLLESFIQKCLKEMQVNPPMIDDYYNWYVYHCHSRQKSILDEADYFAPFGNPTSFDSFRLFQEIPVYCEDKLNADLSHALESSN